MAVPSKTPRIRSDGVTRSMTAIGVPVGPPAEIRRDPPGHVRITGWSVRASASPMRESVTDRHPGQPSAPK